MVPLQPSTHAMSIENILVAVFAFSLVIVRASVHEKTPQVSWGSRVSLHIWKGYAWSFVDHTVCALSFLKGQESQSRPLLSKLDPKNWICYVKQCNMAQRCSWVVHMLSGGLKSMQVANRDVVHNIHMIYFVHYVFLPLTSHPYIHVQSLMLAVFTKDQCKFWYENNCESKANSNV